LSRTRLALVATTCLLPFLPNGAALAQPVRPAAPVAPAPRAPAALRAPAARPARPATGVIRTIHVQGNQRIEEGTILSYMSVAVGDPFDPDRLDRSLKTLYATGLFQDVQLHRAGDTLNVTVVENPIVNRIAFEGNHALTDDNLRTLVQLRPRAVYTPELAQADRQRILDALAKKARFAATVEPKMIRLDQNRVDVVFEINEGESTLISRIAVVGNHAFSEDRLKEVVNSRQEAWWRLLSTSDSYDPERVKYDAELLRRFYLKNGYADFKVTNSTAELSPDHKSFFITFVVDEGERYRVGKVSVDSKIAKVSGDELLPLANIDPGSWYDGDAVERASTALTDAVQNRGYAFVEVNPRVARNPEQHTVDLVFDVGEGPRVYIERLDITGNTRTKDKVIRREFQVAEGDAFNAAALRRTRQRLQDLGYFNNVTINSTPGSAPDRAIITTNVDEKATGELTLGGGYSTDIGALANIGLRERNLIGTGVDASIGAVIAQKETQLNLSVTDPYFLDRNLSAGFDLYQIINNNQTISEYDEKRTGFTLRAGYAFNEHLSQAWSYSLVSRDVYNVASTASIYVLDEAGTSLLSQLGTTVALDYRDSRQDPHSGFLLRGGVDYAGLGGTVDYVRTKLDGGFYIPLDYFTGNSDWSVAETGSVGYLIDLGRPEKIIDRFFLGGDNLRGFAVGGAGPHDATTGDSLGGRLLWTESSELRFPLPISPDLGLTGRAFVDVGALSEAREFQGNPITDSSAPRVGAGMGVSWNTPFGLINIDLAQAVVKQPHDQTQVFRFGFGTRF
jgi:outer membrane protein insertion porin family